MFLSDTPEGLSCTEELKIVFRVNGEDTPGTAVALLDTGCDFDVISTRLVDFYGLTINDHGSGYIADGISGEQTMSLGTVEGRWGHKRNFRRPRFEVSTFHVVESSHFDIIIGRASLETAGLLGRRHRMIAPQFRGHIQNGKCALGFSLLLFLSLCLRYFCSHTNHQG